MMKQSRSRNKKLTSGSGGSNRKSNRRRYFTLERVFGVVVVLGIVSFAVLHHGATLSSSSSSTTTGLDYYSDASVPLSSFYSIRSLLGFGDTSPSSIQPFDLSINHLQKIPYWKGSLHEEDEVATPEDFLPVVESDVVDLRWRLQTVPGADGFNKAIQGISSYQIVAQLEYSPNTQVWDTGRIYVENYKSPRSVEWDYKSSPLKVGNIIRWKVLVWDGVGNGPSTSEWSKFAVGPNQSQWKGKWITHPLDFYSLNTKATERVFKAKHSIPNTADQCIRWKYRMPLPLARVQFQLPRPSTQIVSAVLFVSGLGMFSPTLNGKRLSSSSVHDPPLTDFSQRVNYRGFDVTEELKSSQSNNNNHVVGVSLGSGWWDGRPIRGAIVFMSFMASGSVTTIAELHVTYRNGRSDVLIPTGNEQGDSGWTMGKGFLRDSNLFTGETIDLTSFKNNRGWDTASYSGGDIAWVKPQLYESNVTSEYWRKQLDNFAGTVERNTQIVPGLAPIGRLTPLEMPPVLPIDRIPAVETTSLGNGRWLLDFGKGMSGVVRFEKGLPPPIKPSGGNYSRGHDLSMITNNIDQYITVIHGDSLEMSTGDINLALVAGFGHHNGGERGVAKPSNVEQRGGPCFPPEDLKNYQALTQRDVYLVPHSLTNTEFSEARQPRFTVHGFRFAEVCCTATPPTDAYAIQYRTAFSEWGDFSSSNVILNGAYEMTKNALNSNTLGLQSDCPHRERLQYGGDLVAASPAAMQMFDLSAFYGKIIRDWTTSQFDNGAYGVTSTFMDLLDDRSVAKRGSGETIWAAAPVILGARHMHHYGDTRLADRTLKHHIEWLTFLDRYWDEGIQQKYGKNRNNNVKGGGLGDWLGLRSTDMWLTHHAFYMACARSVAYLASRLNETGSILKRDDAEGIITKYWNKANELKSTIGDAYSTESFGFERGQGDEIYLGQSMGLFARLTPGQNRCKTLKSLLKRAGDGGNTHWPGDEERLFYEHLNEEDFRILKNNNIIHGDREKGRKLSTMYRQRYSENGGIFGIKYSLKTLSEMGFHTLSLTKATGTNFPSYGMMMSFNATTLWETWWRSEDIFSRDHPMLGAVADWLSSAVAGVTLSPTAIGGDDILFWPRIPETVEAGEIVSYASATHGTKHGDAAIAWKLVDGKNNTSQVVIRALVPPGSTATLRLPSSIPESPQTILGAATLPNFNLARIAAKNTCQQRRRKKLGFPFHWEYNRVTEVWRRVNATQTIGTPCPSFLFLVSEDIEWKAITSELVDDPAGGDLTIQPGFYEILIDNWKLKPDLELQPGYTFYKGSLGPYCSDPDTFNWDVKDAEHII